MIVMPHAFVLDLLAEDTANNAVIGIHNLVTASNVTVDSEAMGFPVSNLGNPITHLEWRGNTVDPYDVTVSLSGYEDLVDYVGIARHNFGTAGISVTIEGTINGTDWFELVAEQLLADDAPALFRFEPQGLSSIRMVLGEGSEEPHLACLNVGLLIVMQRRIYVGHTPITLSEDTEVSTGYSENANFLGRIILNEKTETKATFHNLTATWIREVIKPFLRDSKTLPWFWAWRPVSYPLEVGFCWTTSSSKPSNESENGMMEMEIMMRGIVS